MVNAGCPHVGAADLAAGASNVSGIFYTQAEENYMNKIYMNRLGASLLGASAAIAMAGLVAAADSVQPGRSQEPAQKEQIPADGADTAAGNVRARPSTDTTNENPEYAAALRKCGLLTGSERAHCKDETRKKFSEM